LKTQRPQLGFDYPMTKKQGNINTTYEQGNINMIRNICMCNFTLVTTRKEKETRDHQDRKLHERRQRNTTTTT
jgi:hypothetical protein